MVVAPGTQTVREATLPHEHSPVLVEVSYDDVGHPVREFSCTSCTSVWFD